MHVSSTADLSAHHEARLAQSTRRRGSHRSKQEIRVVARLRGTDPEAHKVTEDEPQIDLEKSSARRAFKDTEDDQSYDAANHAEECFKGRSIALRARLTSMG